jgi:hypothetical protein
VRLEWVLNRFGLPLLCMAAARDARKAGRPTGRINGPFRSLAGSGTTAVAPGVGLRDAGLPARGRQHERLEERKQKLKAGQQRRYQQNLKRRQRQVKELSGRCSRAPRIFRFRRIRSFGEADRGDLFSSNGMNRLRHTGTQVPSRQSPILHVARGSLSRKPLTSRRLQS